MRFRFRRRKKRFLWKKGLIKMDTEMRYYREKVQEIVKNCGYSTCAGFDRDQILAGSFPDNEAEIMFWNLKHMENEVILGG